MVKARGSPVGDIIIGASNQGAINTFRNREDYKGDCDEEDLYEEDTLFT
jgi:hypothetical protein